jgi:hypothetical protein
VGHSRSIAIAGSLATCCLLAVGCKMPQPPGDLLGSYHVQGDLTVNECGDEALPAIDPLSFDVQIRRDERSGYWLQGMPPARAGKVGDDGSFAFEMEQVYDVPTSDQVGSDDATLSMDPEKLGDPSYYEKIDAARRSACRLTISETVEGSLLHDLLDDDVLTPASSSSDDDSPDLVGENVIAIAPDSVASCARVMHANGGPFQQLPCQAHYDLTGKLVEGK